MGRNFDGYSGLQQKSKCAVTQCSNSAVTKYAISNLYIYLFPTIVRELVSTMLHFVVTHSSGTVELIVLISALGIKHGVICFVLF